MSKTKAPADVNVPATTSSSSPLAIESVIARVATQFPEEAKKLTAAVRKDIVALGTNEAFALRDSHGEIRAFKERLTFRASEGTLVQPVPGGPFVVSAQGYEHWQEAVGASVIFPKEVLVDGKWQQNPAVIRDPQNRRILAIYARAVAFKFSSKGIPQVSDWTTIFDTPSYRLIDLLGKAKKYPQAFKLYPTELGKPEDPGTWASYPFDESTNLWVNTAHEEALAWFAQILNREKKAIDFAQTFAKRNACKHLSGLQRAPGAEWTVPVLCWRPTNGGIVKWDATRYSALQDRVGGLIGSGGEDFAPDDQPPATTTTMEVKTGKERVSDEEGATEMEREVDPEDQVMDAEFTSTPTTQEGAAPSPVTAPEPPPPPQTDQKPTMLPEELKAKANFEETKKLFPAEHAEACLQLKVPSIYMNMEQAGAVMNRVAKILEGGAE